jgi:hypothetical protein
VLDDHCQVINLMRAQRHPLAIRQARTLQQQQQHVMVVDRCKVFNSDYS